MSKDWSQNPSRCIRKIESAIKGWPIWRERAARYYRPPNQELRLTEQDIAYIRSLNLEKRDESTVLDAMTFILNNKREDVIILSKRQLVKFRNVHQRNYKNKLALLKSLNIIKLKTEAKRVRRMATEYWVLYPFSKPLEDQATNDSVAIRSNEDKREKIDFMILRGQDTKQIRQFMPEVSRQQIYYRRKRIDRQLQHDSFREDHDIPMEYPVTSDAPS